MNNAEAMDALVAKRRVLTGAIDALSRFEQETDRWKATTKTEQTSAIKRLARAGGVDLSAWGGGA